MRRALAVAAGALLAAGASAQPTLPRAEAAGPAFGSAPARAALADTTEAPPEAWIARDKALHLGGSLVLTLAGQYVLTDKAGWPDGRALPAAAASALAVGLLKEIADGRRPRYPHFCWRDLAADAAGVALAAAIVAL